MALRSYVCIMSVAMCVFENLLVLPPLVGVGESTISVVVVMLG